MRKKLSHQFVSENIAIASGVAMIFIALGLWPRSSAETWSLATLSFTGMRVIGACLIIAGLMDNLMDKRIQPAKPHSTARHVKVSDVARKAPEIEARRHGARLPVDQIPSEVPPPVVTSNGTLMQ